MAILMRARFHRMLSRLVVKPRRGWNVRGAPPLQKLVSSSISTDRMILLFQLSQTESRRLAGFPQDVESACSVSFLVLAKSADLVTDTATAVEARAPTPTTIESHEAGIGVAGTVVTAGIAV